MGCVVFEGLGWCAQEAQCEIGQEHEVSARCQLSCFEAKQHRLTQEWLKPENKDEPNGDTHCPHTNQPQCCTRDVF